MEAQSGELALEIKRIFAAPRPVVFAAFTNGDLIAQWWGPQGFTIPAIEFPAEPAERYRIEMQPPEGEAFGLRGEFREVVPPSRLAFSFAWEDPDPDDVENLVSLVFRELEGSTEVSLDQRPFATEARRALHRDGWTDSFEKLEAQLSGRS